MAEIQNTVTVEIKADDHASSEIDSVNRNITSLFRNVSGIITKLEKRIELANKIGEFLADIPEMVQNYFDFVAKLYESIKGPLGDAVSELANKMKSLDNALDPSLAWEERIKILDEIVESYRNVSSEIDRLFEEVKKFKLTIDIEEAKYNIDHLDKRLQSLMLNIDASQALAAVSAVKKRIDSIPDVSVKTLIMRVVTQASPVRPFSEGMDYVEDRLRKLPSGTDYTVRVRGHDSGKPLPAPTASSAGVSFSPTMHVHVSGAGASSGRALAREMDRALSDLWRTNRSELRRTMTQ
jgi:DNA repair ATPase RecN